MVTVEDRPVGQAGILALLYLVTVEAVMFANELAVGPADVPWAWMGLIWGALFAPTLVVAVFAAVVFAPPWQTLRTLYGGTLVATLVVIEVLWLNKSHLGPAVITEAALVITVLLIFRHYA
jgi:hypothetical protein